MQGKDDLTFCGSPVQRRSLEKTSELRKTTSAWLVEASGMLNTLGDGLGTLWDYSRIRSVGNRGLEWRKRSGFSVQKAGGCV